MKKLAIVSLAVLASHAVHAEDFYQPKAEAQIFLVNNTLDPALKSGAFTGTTQADSAALSKLRGNGGAVRLSMLVDDRIKLVGEAGLVKSDRRYGNQDVKYQIKQQELKGGLRFVTAAANGAPVYFEAGADFAYYEFKDKVFFGSSFTEQSAGENPSADSDSTANARSFRGKQDGAYGVAHIRPGYRTKTFHGYADVGYGLGNDGNMIELTAGAAFSLTESIQLIGEYRATTFEDSDGDLKQRALRLGVGAQF